MSFLKLKNAKCQFGNCEVGNACFNKQGETKGKYCKKHAKTGMVDVKNKKCQHSGCRKIPYFNFEGELRGKFCSSHQELGMIDVINKKCQHSGCRKQPTYNFEGEKRAKFCFAHQESGMVDVINKKCQHSGCRKQPTYNFEGEKRAKFCFAHQESGMVNVINKKCQRSGCRTRPYFNFEEELRGKFCFLHKESGMINVISKRCQHENCKNIATYGLLGNIAYHCAHHADKRTELYLPTRRCIKCKELATYGDEYPIHCETHATEKRGAPEEITFEISKCCKCGLQAIINRAGECFFCDEFKIVRLAKQNEIVAFLRTQGLPIESVDTTIDSDCGRERPDIVLNSFNGSFKIIIEVDEHQHKNGSYTNCECMRMKKLAQYFFQPILYFRYNPDEYKTPDIQEVSKNKRLIRLNQEINEFIILEKLPYTVGMIQMYYDGWSENRPVEITVIE
jgi:EsV-1-7 cysteine-rich motif